MTFGQRSSRFFRPGKTPKYSFKVHVEYPQVIQLEHPDPIPLNIYLIPELDPHKTTIIPDNDTSTLPPVQVVSVEMKLKGDFGIRCPGTLWDTDTVKNHTFPFIFPVEIKPVTIPVLQAASKAPDLKQIASSPEHPSEHHPHMPELSSKVSFGATFRAPFSMPQNASLQSEASTTVPEASANTPDSNTALSHAACAPLGSTRIASQGPPLSTPLNLGDHLEVLLGCSAASTCGQRPISFKRQVYPTFSTYNITLKYRLEWKIKMVCADEKSSIYGEYPVRVMPPSEEQESQKKRELGTQGMKKNYDDLEQALGAAVQFIGGILQAVT